MLCAEFHMPRPVRLQRKADPDEAMVMTAKPDADNLIKAVMDAMTDDGWWHDDALVCALVVTKSYAAKEQPTGAAIRVYLLEQGTSVELLHGRA